MKHGESDVERQISIHGINFGKEKEALITNSVLL